MRDWDESTMSFHERDPDFVLSREQLSKLYTYGCGYPWSVQDMLRLIELAEGKRTVNCEKCKEPMVLLLNTYVCDNEFCGADLTDTEMLEQDTLEMDDSWFQLTFPGVE